MTLPVYFSKRDKLPQEKSRAWNIMIAGAPANFSAGSLHGKYCAWLGKKDLGTVLSLLCRKKLCLHKVPGKSMWFSTGRDGPPAWSDLQVQGIRLLLEKNPQNCNFNLSTLCICRPVHQAKGFVPKP